jgi:prepilin-type N-terminal cleavage/methylation domain-containing protein
MDTCVCSPGIRATPRAQAYTIAEMLVVLVILAIVAAAAVPALRVRDSQLDAAAADVGNALRFAVVEATRTGSYVLVDAATQPGRILVLSSDTTAARGPAIADPLTKRSMDIAVSTSAAPGVQLTANFRTASSRYSQLLIGPGPTFWAAQSSIVMGPLQKDSGITLSVGSRTATVDLDWVTGRVLIP